MKKKLLLLFTLLLALMMIFASCGGGQTESSSSEEEELDTYIVSFNLGYDGAPAIEDREIEEGGRIGALPTPVRDGYTFDGWKTESGKTVKSTTAVKEDMVLYAQWTEIPPCFHPNMESAGLTQADCTHPSVLTQRCTNVMCGYTTTTELAPALGHKLTTDAPVAPNCKKEGYTLTHCTRKGCKFEEKKDIVPKLTTHTYSNSWILVRAQTDYSYGQEKRACIICGNLELRELLPNKIDEFALLPIKQVIRDGQVYVGVNSTASASATSLYRVTTAANAIDGRPNTYWRADTLVNKGSYVGDVFNLKLATAFDISVVEFTVPNYWAWKLGDEATVKYDVEIFALDENGENGQWIKVGTVSDSDVKDSLSKNAVVQLELDKIYKTNQIRATVTHATRYTPAMIYELQVYGKVEEFVRTPQSISALAGGKITGSYNSWVNSSHANLLDNSTQTSWCTDARRWEDYQEYGRSSRVTFWSEDYGVDNKQTISKVVVKADKLVGETIDVLVCRSYMVDKVVDKKDPNTGEVMKDSEGNAIKETIQEAKNEWISLGVKEIDGSFGGSFEFVPTGEGVDSISDVVMLRVEVDNFGVDENKDDLTVTSVVATLGTGEVTYNDLEWTYRKKVYASFEFPQEQYLAYIDIVCNKDAGRVMSLQFWVEDSNYTGGGYWEEYRRIEVLESSSQTGIATFTIDVGDYHTKFRLEVVKEPAIFGAYIYDVTPYTVAEVAKELPKGSECLHKFAQAEATEIVEATCIASGYSIFKCVSCDLTWKTDATDLLEHTWALSSHQDIEGDTVYNKYICRVRDCEALMREAASTKVGSATITTPKISKYYHNASGAWSMVFDDGNYTASYEWLTPELVKRNMMATAGLTDSFSSSLISEWTGWIATGAWDVASHSLNHGGGFSDATIDENTMAKEVDEAHYKFMSYFPGQRILGFVTPNGATSDATANYVNDLMAAGRNGGQTGSFTDPNKLVTRENWGNLSSYVSYTTTTGDDYKKAIDDLVKGGLWTVECHHDLSVSKATPQFSTDINAVLVKLDYFITKNVWCASFTQAIQYLRESHTAYVNSMSATDTSISLEVTDTLDDTMFQFPLTLEMELPSGWTNVTVTQNGVNIPVVDPSAYKPNMAEDMACTIINGTLYFDAVPDGGVVTITKN